MDYARMQTRSDPHTLAHQGAMHASIWAMRSVLQRAGEEIDQHPENSFNGQIRALAVRHLVEQACSDLLRRFARAYGPYPLAMNEKSAQRYQELDLYLRQSHGEKDLASLGELLRDRHGTLKKDEQ